MEVTIYTTQTCGYCRQAKEYLASRGIPYTEKAVDEDYPAALEMARLSRQQGVPVIVVNGQVVVGFDRPRLEALLAGARGGKVSFGASVADAANFLAKKGQIPIFGAYVGKVSPGSPAEKLGLAPGDIITQINLRPITNAAGIAQVVAALNRGDRLAVEYMRGERALGGSVTV